MNLQKSGVPLAHRPAVATPRRAAALAAALTLAASLAVHALAEDGAGDAQAIGSSGLRTASGLDLSTEMRLDPAGLRTSANPPTSRDLLPAAPAEPAPVAEDADGGADDDPDAEAPPPPRRPRLDLFDGPSARRDPLGASGPRDRVRPVAEAAEPAAGGIALPGDTEPESRVVIEPDPPARAEDGPDVRAILPPAPTRSARIGALESRTGRMPIPAAPVRSATQDDPFAPIGQRLGRFRLSMQSDTSLGVSDNLKQTPVRVGGAFGESALSARLVSDWVRHQADLAAQLRYRRDFAGEDRSDPALDLAGGLRLDLDRLTTADVKGTLSYRREDAADLDPVTDGTAERPDILDGDLQASLERAVGRGFLRGTVQAARETRSRGDGEALRLNEDFSTVTGALRAGYRLSPAFAPFVETSFGRRLFDRSRDLDGQARDASVASLRGGLAFDFGEKLTGEIAAGYAEDRPDREDSPAVGTPTLDARLAWSPRRGTQVAWTASTTFDPDTAGGSTSSLYETGLAVEHRATARLALSAGIGAGWRDSRTDSEKERTWGVTSSFTYWLNRTLALIGSASHDTVDRVSGPGDYDVNTVKLGIRVQN